MGLIYARNDSLGLINALKANLKSANETTENLKRGSDALTEAIDGNTLSGAAYTAGKGLFMELIIPTIDRVSDAVKKIESELNSYQRADEIVAGEGYLDEDNLKQQIAIKRSLKAATEALARVLSGSPLTAERAGDLYRFAASLQNDIDGLDRRLGKLIEFAFRTNGLFHNSINDLNIAMQCVLALNETTVNSDGTYNFPTGANKTWFSQAHSYSIDDMAKEFGKGVTDIKEWLEASADKLFDNIKDTIFKGGKNIGKSWGAKLQPRVNGKFVVDSFKPRQLLSGTLKSIPNSTSQVIGKVAKWGGRGLVAVGFALEAKDYYDEYHNVGRAISYGAVSTVAVVGAGAIGSAIGGAIAVGLGAAATGVLATFAAPVIGAVTVGVAVSFGVKYLYNNSKFFKDHVDKAGDTINDFGNSAKNEVKNIGKAFSSSLDPLKGCFG